MQSLDIKNYLYHGIIDWLNYDKNFYRENFCLEKLESILNNRYIVKPSDFERFNIKHLDTANPYTYYFTFLAYHKEFIYKSRFSKEKNEDNGYLVATYYANFGILFNPILLNELTICNETFCDNEIKLEDNISLDKYGVGIYLKHSIINDNLILKIEELVRKYEYNFDIIDISNGNILTLKKF